MRRVSLALALLLAFACCRPTAQAAKYEFTFDGKPLELAIDSLSGEVEPQPGDLLTISGLLLTLGTETTGDLSFDDEEGRLLRSADGNTRVIGLRMDRVYGKTDGELWNPLAKLTPAEIHGLWGIRLDWWARPLSEQLQHADFDRVCLSVADGAWREWQHLDSPLPSQLRYLRVFERTGEIIIKFAPLERLKSLQYFSLDLYNCSNPVDLNCRLIAECRQLKRLDVNGALLDGSDSLANLSQLRTLRLSSVGQLHDLEFTRGLRELREVDVQDSTVSSLEPLAKLEKLRKIQASRTKVARLPDGPLPALEELCVYNSKVSDADAAKFRQTHPRVRLLHRWNEALSSELAGVNRIRIRSGGTSNRNMAGEITLADVRDPAEVGALIASLAVEEDEASFYCICDGDPSFEFYTGGRLVTTIGLHHGSSVRWPGKWSSDALLTEASVTRVLAWLVKHGVTGPQEAHMRELERAKEELERARRGRELRKRQELALKRHLERIYAVLPPAMSALVRKADSAESVVQAFVDGVPNPVQRAVLCLHVLSCDSYSWVDGVVSETLLPQFTEQELRQAVLKAADDPAIAAGAARWLLLQQQHERIDAATLDQVLPIIAPHGLKHPRAETRLETLLALGRICTAPALAQLRKALAQETPAPLKADDADDYPHDEAAPPPPRSSRVDESYSNRINAALVLAEVGDGESLPALEKLAGNSMGQIKQDLDDALRYFGMTPPPRKKPDSD